MGPMVGYAVTVVIQPGNKKHAEENPDAWYEYMEYLAAAPGPKIVVVQDLDEPNAIESFWGEVNSNFHKALGCVGTITDGAIRDVDEMNNAGFKAIARRLCVSHAYSIPIRWNCEVEVFGCRVSPGQIIHADKHGFVVIPPEDCVKLLDAAVFTDGAECSTKIQAARSAAGKSMEDIIDSLKKADKDYMALLQKKFGKERK